MNVTVAVQVAATASDVPQSFVAEKSPLAVIEAMFAGPVPLFMSVMAAVLEVLNGVSGNTGLPGENWMYGASGGSVTDCPTRTAQAR